MGQNFLSCDRDQLWLMPPSVAEWLPADHLAWFVIDAVGEFDLGGFVCRYRADGRGGAAYPPAVMVGLIVYAYAVGELSSRRIQRRCVEDVAFRVVAANLVPDHATIARFRVMHAEALAGLFGQVLAMCDRAGLIKAGLLAVDGTKIGANASRDANRTSEQLARDLIDEAAVTDAVEDELFGDGSGPSMPADMVGADRKARLRKLKQELDAEAEARSFDVHMRERAEHEASTGRRLQGRRPQAGSRRFRSRQHANTTDPDSRLHRVRGGSFMQGYNAQIVVTEAQFVVAAEVTTEVTDRCQFQPMVRAAKANLNRTRVRRHRVRTVVADAGYWAAGNVNMAGVEALISPAKARELNEVTEQEAARTEVLERVENGEITVAEAVVEIGVGRDQVNNLLRRRRNGQPPPLTSVMAERLATPRGKRLYKKRSASVEPVFAQIKHNRRIRTFHRRGLAAVDSEWKLITATHNLLKLWRHTVATT